MKPFGHADHWAGIVAGPAGVELAGESVQRFASLTEAAAQCRPRECRFVTAIAGTQVWCHSLTLPTTVPEELRQMVSLRLDELSPLPAEESACGFMPLEKTGTGTRVLLAIAPRAVVDEQIGALENAGLPAQIVSVDVLAVFRELARRGRLPVDAALRVFVLIEPNCAALIGFVAGQLLVVRSLPVTDPAEVAGEIRRTRLALELERPDAAPGAVIIATAHEELRPVADQLRAQVDAVCLPPTDLPSVAESLRGEAAASEGTLNLLTDQWREKRKRARLRRRLRQGGLALAGLYVLALAAFGAAWFTRQWRLNDLNRQIREQQPEFAEARNARNSLLALQTRLDTQQTALELLREVSLLLPSNVRLTGYSFKKAQSVTLRGETGSAGMASDLLGRLESCPLFSSTKASPMPTLQDGITKFEVVCALKKTKGATP